MTDHLLPWPASLKAASAVDNLARAVYQARCDFHDVPDQPWEDVPTHVRSGLVELALRALRALGPPTATAPDTLFRLASDLARAEGQRHV